MKTSLYQVLALQVMAQKPPTLYINANKKMLADILINSITLKIVVVELAKELVQLMLAPHFLELDRNMHQEHLEHISLETQ